MSILDSIGGLGGGLGGSGGVGGSIPSNTSSANSSAETTINPSIAVGQTGGGYFELGPFAPVFPGAVAQPNDAVNSPPGLSYLIPKGTTGVALMAVAVLVLLVIFFKR